MKESDLSLIWHKETKQMTNLYENKKSLTKSYTLQISKVSKILRGK